MLRLAKLLAVLPRAAHFAGGWLLLLLAFVIGYDVVGRKFFNTGSILLQDLEWHLHGAALMLGFGSAYLNDAHVRVDLFREKFTNRTKIRLEIFGILAFLLPYIAMLVWFSLSYVSRAWVTGEGSVGGAGLPNRWIIKLFLTIGFSLVLLSALSVLLRCFAVLKADGEPESPFLSDRSS